MNPADVVDQGAKRWIHQSTGYEQRGLMHMVDPLRLIHDGMPGSSSARSIGSADTGNSQ